MADLDELLSEIEAKMSDDLAAHDIEAVGVGVERWLSLRDERNRQNGEAVEWIEMLRSIRGDGCDKNELIRDGIAIWSSTRDAISDLDA